MALPELNEAEKLFKGGIWDALIDLGLAALFVQFPFLNIFLVRDAVRWLVTKFGNAMWEFATQMLNLQYIVFKNQALQKDFIEAALRLKGIALQDGLDSPAYKEARLEHQKVFAAHVRSLLVSAI